MVEHLPLAQGMLPGSWVRVPHWAPCREPNVGLEPRTLGACPEPKADAQPLSHPGIPKTIFIEIFAKANVYNKA